MSIDEHDTPATTRGSVAGHPPAMTRGLLLLLDATAGARGAAFSCRRWPKVVPLGAKLARYPGPTLAGGEPPGTGGEPPVARWTSTRAAGMRSCSRASRASARASAAVGWFTSRARGHSRE